MSGELELLGPGKVLRDCGVLASSTAVWYYSCGPRWAAGFALVMGVLLVVIEVGQWRGQGTLRANLKTCGFHAGQPLEFRSRWSSDREKFTPCVYVRPGYVAGFHEVRFPEANAKWGRIVALEELTAAPLPAPFARS
jgi:hypothetical protein